MHSLQLAAVASLACWLDLEGSGVHLDVLVVDSVQRFGAKGLVLVGLVARGGVADVVIAGGRGASVMAQGLVVVPYRTDAIAA